MELYGRKTPQNPLLIILIAAIWKEVTTCHASTMKIDNFGDATLGVAAPWGISIFHFLSYTDIHQISKWDMLCSISSLCTYICEQHKLRERTSSSLTRREDEPEEVVMRIMIMEKVWFNGWWKIHYTMTPAVDDFVGLAHSRRRGIFSSSFFTDSLLVSQEKFPSRAECD